MKTQINFYDYMGKQYDAIITKDMVYNNCDIIIIFQHNEYRIKSIIIDIDENTRFIRAYRTTKD